MRSPPSHDEIDPYYGAHTHDKYWDSELDLKVSFLFHECFMVRSGFRGEAHKGSRVILSHSQPGGVLNLSSLSCLVCLVAGLWVGEWRIEKLVMKMTLENINSFWEVSGQSADLFQE